MSSGLWARLPDGDSVRFYPTDRDVWSRAGIKVRANAHGGVQLRLDAIDALETHFSPRSSPHPWHQNPTFGDAADTALLALLNFSDVVRNQGGIVTDATPPSEPGAILTKFADKYGRASQPCHPLAEVTAEPSCSQPIKTIDDPNLGLSSGW